VLNFHRAPDLTMDSFPGQLGEVLTHITLNCITHAFVDSERGTIDITLLGTHPNHIEIVIADDGCGMTPEFKRRPFAPFFPPSRQRGAGGLGLHTVYNIVAERLGGRVKLESKSGTGTTVQLILPRSAPRAD